MRAILEKQPVVPDSFRVFTYKAAQFNWNWHYHAEYELTWIQKGRGTRLVGDHAAEYGSNDLVLLGPNLPHTWASANTKRLNTSANQQIVAHFRAEVFPEALLTLPEYEGVTRLLSESQRGLHFSSSVARAIGPDFQALADERNRLASWTRLAHLLNKLSVWKSAQALASDCYHHASSYKLNMRLTRVIAYMENHHGDETPLNKIAQIAGMTPSAFSRFFHRTTGTTFVYYRNACRIREACRLLSETDEPITDIAYTSGFGNLANFNRQFRAQKKMTPLGYRRAYHPAFASECRKRDGQEWR